MMNTCSVQDTDANAWNSTFGDLFILLQAVRGQPTMINCTIIMARPNSILTRTKTLRSPDNAHSSTPHWVISLPWHEITQFINVPWIWIVHPWSEHLFLFPVNFTVVGIALTSWSVNWPISHIVMGKEVDVGNARAPPPLQPVAPPPTSPSGRFPPSQPLLPPLRHGLRRQQRRPPPQRPVARGGPRILIMGIQNY
jgi:hypothetical protein